MAKHTAIIFSNKKIYCISFVAFTQFWSSIKLLSEESHPSMISVWLLEINWEKWDEVSQSPSSYNMEGSFLLTKAAI